MPVRRLAVDRFSNNSVFFFPVTGKLSPGSTGELQKVLFAPLLAPSFVMSRADSSDQHDAVFITYGICIFLN